MNKSNTVNSLRVQKSDVNSQIAPLDNHSVSQKLAEGVTHLETGTFCPPDQRHQSSRARRGGHLRLKGERETSKAGRARPERHGRSSIVPPQQWRAITAETVISRGLPGTVPASLWAIRVDCVAERAQTKHIRGVRRHTWGLSDGKREKKRKKKSILPRRYIGRWRQCVVRFPGPDVCVCVFECVEMSSAFLLHVFFSRCVTYRDPQLRARSSPFPPPPPRFFILPQQQHVDPQPKGSFIKKQCGNFL